MRSFFMIGFLLVLQAYVAAAFSPPSTTSLLNELNKTIQNKENYLKEKNIRIDRLKNRLQKNDITLEGKFNIYNKLFYEYGTFKYDSAFACAVQLQKIARYLNNPVKINDAKLKLCFTLLSSGMYKESLDSLSTIVLTNMPDSIKTEYYVLQSRSYYELAAYNADVYYTNRYIKIGNSYSDSAIALTDKETLQFYFLRGIKELKEQKFKNAEQDFQLILNKFNPSYKQYGTIASALASVYLERGEKDKGTALMIKAAIADVKSATKEGLALASVADLLYKAGEEKLAYSYIKEALDDATFYGARLRKMHVASILPIIAGERLATVETQRTRILTYAIAVSLLSLIVVTFSFIIFKQLKQLRQAKRTVTEANISLQEANDKLKQVNDVLHDKNNELLEANRIKEEYIGYSFNMYSEYLEKIEKLKISIEKKLRVKKYDDIDHVMDSINLRKEREYLYLSFDRVFLKLFPDFVPYFNSFFREEDRFISNNAQSLNIELRIFALIRMGIHDHEQIAKILEYSVRTVYNYKTKVKNKSILSNDEFERKIMEIKAF